MSEKFSVIDARFCLQFISDATNTMSHLDAIAAALQGGCRWIQLRMKEATDEEVRDVASQALDLCRKYNAVFIIDDRTDIAKEVGADGVHLGKNDMPLKEARRILPENAIIGGTANTIDDIRQLWIDGADYIGCGPFRFTTTKKNLAPVIGLDGYRKIYSAMNAEGISLPVVAIGGITKDDVADIMQTGMNGIAVSGTVTKAKNPADEMRKLNILVRKPI